MQSSCQVRLTPQLRSLVLSEGRLTSTAGRLSAEGSVVALMPAASSFWHISRARSPGCSCQHCVQVRPQQPLDIGVLGQDGGCAYVVTPTTPSGLLRRDRSLLT